MSSANPIKKKQKIEHKIINKNLSCNKLGFIELKYKKQIENEIKNDITIANPPILTRGFRCCFLELGLSIKENLFPNFIIFGTNL